MVLRDKGVTVLELPYKELERERSKLKQAEEFPGA